MSIARGLVGWWRFENNLLDSSGNGNNGTANGTVTHPTGKYGKGVSTGPTTLDNVEFPGSASDLAFVHQTMVWTISFWWNISSLSDLTFRSPYWTNGGSSSNTGITIGLDSRKIGGVPETNDTFRIISPSGTVDIQNAIMAGWHHYSMTANGTSGGYIFYRDGAQVGTGTITKTQSGSSHVDLLTARSQAVDVMDNLILENYPRTLSEIKTLYALGSPL